MSCRKIRIGASLAAGGAALAPACAWAVDAVPGWRPTYDLVMMWVNFAILAALLWRYLRPLIAKFLEEYRSSLVEDYEDLTRKKQAAQNQLQTFQAEMAGRRRQLEVLQQRILDQGEKERQAAVASARHEAQRMLESTQLRMANRIRRARDKLKAEIVDQAAELALTELPRLVTPEIEARRLDRYLDAIQQVGRRTPKRPPR